MKKAPQPVTKSPSGLGGWSRPPWLGPGSKGPDQTGVDRSGVRLTSGSGYELLRSLVQRRDVLWDSKGKVCVGCCIGI